MEGSIERRCDKQEACGKWNTIVCTCTKLSNKQKKKKKNTMALNKHIPMNFKTITNQKIGVRNSGEYGGKVRQAGGVWERWYHHLEHWIEQTKMNENEIHYVVLDGCLLMNFTQQPTKNSSTVERGGATIRERGGCKSIGDRVGSMLKTKIKLLTLQIELYAATACQS